jgi:hypothetical protein
MEYYKKIFEGVDLASLRGASFKTKIGNFITLSKLIYNGFSYNFGTIDGAVVIMNNYALWRFIAPANRWSHDDFEGKSLSETLRIVGEESAVVPVVAWDEFCKFLAGGDNLVIVNQIMFGKTSSIKIAYKNTDLPLLSGITDFPSFAKWLYTHMGEVGDEPHDKFHTSKGLAIPIDIYQSTPVSFTLKTPAEEPPYPYMSDTVMLKGEGVTAGYTNKAMDGTTMSRASVFRCKIGEDIYVFGFEDGEDWMTSQKHPSYKAGWNKWNGTYYERYDMEANPVVIPYTEGMEWSYLAKAFTDIQWETTGEKKYRVKSTIDLSAFAGKEFICYGFGSENGFECRYVETDVAHGLVLYYGNETESDIYYYLSEETEIENGVIAPRGWSIVVPDDSETGYHVEPYEMDLVISLVDGQYETNNESLVAKIVDLAEDTTVTKEKLNGTIHFVFTF